MKKKSNPLDKIKIMCYTLVTIKRKELIFMKNFISTMNKDYTFYLHFIDLLDFSSFVELKFSVSAPHYEAAVAQALARGQQITRNAEEQHGQKLFMRLSRD